MPSVLELLNLFAKIATIVGVGGVIYYALLVRKSVKAQAETNHMPEPWHSFNESLSRQKSKFWGRGLNFRFVKNRPWFPKIEVSVNGEDENFDPYVGGQKNNWLTGVNIGGGRSDHNKEENDRFKSFLDELGEGSHTAEIRLEYESAMKEKYVHRYEAEFEYRKTGAGDPHLDFDDVAVKDRKMPWDSIFPSIF